MSRVAKRFYRVDSLHGLDNLDRGESAALENRWVFEISHEAANKVGGIYQVIRSKCSASVEELGEQYVLLGPYKETSVRTEVELGEFPADSPLTASINHLRASGWGVHPGRWLVDGNPQIILFDINSAVRNLDEYKEEFYQNTKIGIPHPDIECNDAVLFGFMVSKFIEEFRAEAINYSDVKPRICAHFHEWLAGVGLVILRMRNVDVATIFTTHATLLGRFLCAGAVDFYNNLDKFNLDEEAGMRGIYHRYCMERCSAHLAHTFTTVSEITGIEAEHLLKRKPDIITPNGLNVKKFSALHEFQNLHALSKEKINDFIRGHFYGFMDFDLDKTLYFFIAGRYEFGNKGADLYIEALARLNHYMKASGTDKTVIAFMIFPAKTNNFNVESLRGQAVTKSLRDAIHDIQAKMGKRMYEICLTGRLPEPNELLLKEEMVRLKRCIYAAQRKSLPPITTHNVTDDTTDPVLSALRRCRLFNDPHDRVKVIFHPEFLSVTNPLFGMDYEEFVRGCHLGVFPSYYEPWGYTPAECTVMGIPSVTTNLSGFGCFMAEHIADPMSYGIYIIDRRYIGLEESVRQLAQNLFEFVQLNRRQRIIQRNRTERLSELLDWRILGTYYRQGRQHALHTVYPELALEEAASAGRLNYPRPLSEPPSPTSSRATTPAPSEHGSDDEDAEDSIDSEAELEELGVGESANGSVSSRMEAGRTYGGCSDSFSVFGFLAFLLALLDLILELQGMDGSMRRRRAADGITPSCQEDQPVLQATSASYSLLRGFLNALAADDADCAKRFLCEGAEEAAAAGPLGKVVATVGSQNAGSWLLQVNSTLFADVGSAGQAGASEKGCGLRYPRCLALPDGYRYPGVYRGPHLPSQVYHPVIDQVLDVARDTLP